MGADGGQQRVAVQVRSLKIPFDPGAIISSVNSFGNWVGGNVHVFSDRIVFSMNRADSICKCNG
jgi:hypothetical protein